jgi:hypothetical protein
MGLLDGKVPYVLALGNHDIGLNGSSKNRDSNLANTFFPFEKYSKQKGFGGTYKPNQIENAYFTFRAGNIDWLVLSLEFGIRNCVLEWANTIISQHTKHKVIINTHAYMNTDNIRIGKQAPCSPLRYNIGKAEGTDAANDGEMIWEKLVSGHPNIMFVFSGHVVGKGVGTLVSKGKQGNNVYQMLANYQMRPQGGEGYLRIVTCDVKNKTLDIKTYSPLLKKYLEEPEQQFSFSDVDFSIP